MKTLILLHVKEVKDFHMALTCNWMSNKIVIISTYHQAAKVGKVVATTGDSISVNFNKFTSISSPVSMAT